MTISGPIWIAGYLVLLSCAAVGAEFLRARRLRRFGDPMLLNAECGAGRIAAALLTFLGAAGALAGILLGDAARIPAKARGPLAVLIDAGTIDSTAAERGSVGEIVRAAAGQFPDSRVAIFRSESTLEQVAPETSDLEGAVMLADRLRQSESDAGLALRSHAEVLLASAGRPNEEPILQVITRRPPAEAEALFEGAAFASTLLVSVSEVSSPSFGARTVSGRWAWSSDPAAPSRTILDRRRIRRGAAAWLEGIGRTRVFASIAFVLLAAQTMLELRRARPRVRIR